MLRNRDQEPVSPSLSPGWDAKAWCRRSLPAQGGVITASTLGFRKSIQVEASVRSASGSQNRCLSSMAGHQVPSHRVGADVERFKKAMFRREEYGGM